MRGQFRLQKWGLFGWNIQSGIEYINPGYLNSNLERVVSLLGINGGSGSLMEALGFTEGKDFHRHLILQMSLNTQDYLISLSINIMIFSYNLVCLAMNIIIRKLEQDLCKVSYLF